MAPRTLAEFLEDATARFGTREMLAFAPEGTVTERFSGLELLSHVARAAHWLAELGVTKGTHLGLICTNRPEWVFYAFGAWHLGAVVVPLSTLWKPHEIAYALHHADVEILVSMSSFRSRDFRSELAVLLPEIAQGSEAEPFFHPGFPNLRRARFFPAGSHRAAGAASSVAARASFVEAMKTKVHPSDRAVIFFTSGTTARPKAVVHCHEALLVSAERISRSLGIDESDSWWGHMPLFWTGGFVLGLLATWSGGGRVVLQERVEPQSALNLLERERCTIMAGWHQAGPLLDHPDFPRRQLALRKGSAHPLAPRLLVQPHYAVGMYGLSETATCVACADWDEPLEIRTQTCGKPLPGTEICIRDPDTGSTLAAGMAGEICVRGVTLMEGYYKVAREETFDSEGFFHTGDLGFLDDTGRLHFVGRLKDVIKTAGVNVAAREVEETLQQHPAVESAHVVGVPHPARGENIAAFVVLRSGAEVAAPDLIAFCRNRLASYKVPRHLFFLHPSALPRTATGKIEKGKLRAEAIKRVEEETHPSGAPLSET
ncbi:MAG: AMP-binding protein [Candidatus Binatia bacterium]|nr:MAG: AMP-binding protein [Candidatus Binatia bacterium]